MLVLIGGRRNRIVQGTWISGTFLNKSFSEKNALNSLAYKFPSLLMCVCDCAQGSCPQQWLCCVGLGWGSWWWAPGCSEEVEEPPLQTSESEEQELLLMESPSFSSSSLLVLLSLHKQSSLEVSLHTPLLTTLCTGCEYSCTVLVPFPSCFPFLGFLCFVGFCTSNIFYFVLIYLPFFF